MNTEENNLEPNYPTNLNSSETQSPQSLPNYQQIPSESEKIVQQRMESLSGSFSKDVKTIDSIWEIISFLSWILYIGSKWDNFAFYFQYHSKYYPLIYDKTLFECFTLIVSLIGFLIYIKNIIYAKKETNLYKALFDEHSRYHVAPLILYATLKIVSESFREGLSPSIVLNNYLNDDKDKDDGYDAFSPKAFYSFVMILNLLILGSIIFVYNKTTMNCEWYTILTIKKGIYSILIMESWYGFFETILFLRYYDSREDEEKLSSLYKVGGIIFSLIVGMGAFVFAFFKKDIMILIVNFFIYLGMSISFFGNSGPDEDELELINGNADGIIEVIMLTLNAGLIVFLLIRFREKLLE